MIKLISIYNIIVIIIKIIIYYDGYRDPLYARKEEFNN
jgi:hypothetical protein